MILYNKIKEFVKGYLFNKVQKENKSNLLMLGFAEGDYNVDEDYTEESMITGEKRSEGIEEMIEEAEEIIDNAGAH